VNEDFYIGYETGIPASARSSVRRAVAMAMAALLIAGLTVVASQSPLPQARFEFGAADAFAGVVRLEPEPALETASGRVLLVGPGKRGAAHLVGPFANQSVALRGALIERPGLRLVEVVPGSIAAGGAVPSPTSEPPLTDAGDVTLNGEIVDAKCYGGVMNPGEGTVHRDCARACLRGGLPPMLVVRTPAGIDALFALESADGARAGAAVAALAGRPVRVSGRAFVAADGRRILRLAQGAIEPR
jgi:hypothetical protein